MCRFVELHGDRAGLDDPAMVCGLASMDGISFMFIGHQKGRNTKVDSCSSSPDEMACLIEQALMRSPQDGRTPAYRPGWPDTQGLKSCSVEYAQLFQSLSAQQVTWDTAGLHNYS